jgi:hypothetical protein
MTRALPFTEASIARRIKGVEKAGRHAIGVTADGTVLIGEKPLDPSSLVPAEAQTSPTAETRRMGDFFNGGSSEAQGS